MEKGSSPLSLTFPACCFCYYCNMCLLLLRLATWAVARPTTAFLPFPLPSPPLARTRPSPAPSQSHRIPSLTHSHSHSAIPEHMGMSPQRGCTGLHFSARPAVALRFS